MNLINLLQIIFFFAILLLTITVARKNLTYKGVQLMLIFTNFILLSSCCFFWSRYIVNYGTENALIKLNSHNWVGLSYELNFKINSLNFLFLFLVSIIGFATNIYIFNYFKFEERGENFVLLINWFIFSMIFLVIGNNFFTLIIGWELIGLTSFLLINFWKFKITTLSCSFKAFTFNKVSDVFLLISFCVLWNVYKVNNIDTLLNLISMNTSNNTFLLKFSAVCLILCSSIKSAQIIGHLWLPDSMEAPVPASSLIHSATLVSAGIYLLLKFQLLIQLTNLSEALFYLGSITACYGGLVAASQTDMKKLLAYSTISHCGFIVASISLNNFIITIIYLYLHGLFKASTFFCAGSIIKYNNTQDMRYMGMNKNQVFNIITLIISSINLGGLPFTFGYLYKQTFLTILTTTNYNLIPYGFCIIGLLCSIVYVFKLIYYSCFDFRKGNLHTIILYIQNNVIPAKYLFSQFSYIKVFAFFIIYSFSIITYIIMKYFLLKTHMFYYYSSEVIVNQFNFLGKYFYLKNYLVSIYYILFTAVIIVLILNSWRANYFFHDKQSIIINVYGWSIFLLFTHKITNYLNFYLVSLIM